MQTLEEILKKVDQIDDDYDFMAEEYEAIHNYCSKKNYVLSAEELDIIKERGYLEWYEDWMRYEKDGILLASWK